MQALLPLADEIAARLIERKETIETRAAGLNRRKYSWSLSG